MGAVGEGAWLHTALGWGRVSMQLLPTACPNHVDQTCCRIHNSQHVGACTITKVAVHGRSCGTNVKETLLRATWERISLGFSPPLMSISGLRSSRPKLEEEKQRRRKREEGDKSGESRFSAELQSRYHQNRMLYGCLGGKRQSVGTVSGRDRRIVPKDGIRG